MFIFNVTDATGAISGLPHVRVYDSKGRLKGFGGTPVGTVAWGSITGLVTNQTDLINYLNLNFYPLSTNPAGYLTDAPSDGSTYGRNNGAWVVVSGSGTLLALPFTADHLTATSNPYVIGDVVWYSGNVYRCIANNDSILPTNASYWTSLGAGYPLVQQPADWNSTSGNNQILNKPTIPTVVPAALTKTDDTNVTLTLGGTPATALLEATSLTLGWTGVLATGRGGTGLSTIGTPLQYLRVDAGGTALEYATLPTINTYTVDNGLTENPANNFQLGGALIQDTNIDGVGSGTWMLDFTNLHSSTNSARYSYSFATNHSGNNTLLSLDSLTNVSRFSHEDVSTAISAIELTGTELRVQTPLYSTKTAGDVLTLSDPITGEAEWQTILGLNPGFQDVLINDSTLTQNNTVNGANFNFIWDVFNRYTINTDEYILLNSTSGSKIASVSVNTLGVAPYIELNTKNGGIITGIYVDTTQVLIKTPGVDAATVSNGYVLTLTDAASGKVEFQNAATTGDSLSPLLLMGG